MGANELAPIRGALDQVMQRAGVPTEGGVQVVRETMETLKSIRTFILNEFKKDIDFGVIPGTGGKNTLLQPGAQKTAMFFNAAPDHAVTPHEIGNGHVEYVVTTRLVHRGTGACIGSGVGSCSTMEKKYRYRDAGRKCPKCGADAIIVGKREYGGGFVCFARKGGCGAKFKDGDPAIVGQAGGKAENPDIYEVRNTVLKIAVKRSFVAASLSLGCLSELFTQDIEETYDLDHEPEPPPAPRPREPHPNDSGHKTGKYASDEQVEAYRRATIEFCSRKNAEWADEWTDEHGELADGIKDVLHPIQVTNHLFKFLARAKKLSGIDLTVDPETGKLTEKVSSDQAKKLVAVVFAREPQLIADEGERYFRQEAEKAREDWRRKHAQERVEGKGDAWEPD